MKIHLLKLYWDEFRKRKKKMGLITFAITWGTLSILLMMSFGRGLSNAGRVNFKGFGDNFIIFSGGQTIKEFQGLSKGRRIRFYKEDIDLLRRLPDVKLISPESNNIKTISYKGKETNRDVCGVFSCFGEMRAQIPAPGSRFINPDDDLKSRRVAFMGWKVARELFGSKNPVGESIIINRMPFTVIGVLKQKTQDSDYGSPDSEKVVIPFSTFALIDSQRFLDRIHIKTFTEEQAIRIESQVRRIMGRKYRFAGDDTYAINIWNTVKDFKTGEQIFKGIEMFMGILGGLTLLISAVGVTNLMYAIVKERTREIGIKMALGAKRRHIVTQFFLETLFIFFKGTTWGTLIAFNLVALVRSIPISMEDVSAQSYFLRPIFSFDILLIFLGVVGILVFLSGVFPAMRAAKLSPVDALRYE